MAKQKINQSQSSGTTLGYAEITSTFTTTTTGSYVDVTGLSVTVTAPGGRDLKITVFQTGTYASTAIALTNAIREGSTVLNQSYVNASATSTSYTIVARAVAPSAGSHTYTASVATSGASTLTVQAGSNTFNNPGKSYIWVQAA